MQPIFEWCPTSRAVCRSCDYGLVIVRPLSTHRSSASDDSGSDGKHENGRLAPTPHGAAARSLATPPRSYRRLWKPGADSRAPSELFEAAQFHCAHWFQSKTLVTESRAPNLAVSG
jgi:hypothetical protein